MVRLDAQLFADTFGVYVAKDSRLNEVLAFTEKPIRFDGEYANGNGTAIEIDDLVYCLDYALHTPKEKGRKYLKVRQIAELFECYVVNMVGQDSLILCALKPTYRNGEVVFEGRCVSVARGVLESSKPKPLSNRLCTSKNGRIEHDKHKCASVCRYI